jgi:hypothetical protein
MASTTLYLNTYPTKEQKQHFSRNPEIQLKCQRKNLVWLKWMKRTLYCQRSFRGFESRVSFTLLWVCSFKCCFWKKTISCHCMNSNCCIFQISHYLIFEYLVTCSHSCQKNWINRTKYICTRVVLINELSILHFLPISLFGLWDQF